MLAEIVIGREEGLRAGRGGRGGHFVKRNWELEVAKERAKQESLFQAAWSGEEI